MKAKTFMIADTETVGLPPNNVVYDLAYTIATRKNVILSRSFLVREIITDADKMMSAYFAKKIFSDYIPALDTSTMKLYNWEEIVATMRDDMLTHNVSVFSAYNIHFDMRAIAATNNLFSTDKVLTYKPDLLDLWTFSCTTVLNTRLYHDVARENNWVSNAGNVRTTAEKTFAFLTGNLDFEESHTALHDAEIETHILQRLLARKKKIPYNQLPAMPWQLAQKVT